MTLNGVMAVILRYFCEFGYLPGAMRKSSRSLSHLLMSSCPFYFGGIRELTIVRELSSLRVEQSARCPVRELAIRELAYPRVVQLPLILLSISLR